MFLTITYDLRAADAKTSAGLEESTTLIRTVTRSVDAHPEGDGILGGVITTWRDLDMRNDVRGRHGGHIALYEQ